MSLEEKGDRYVEARRKLRTSSHEEAMRRLWEMGREALTVLSLMGVSELRYETDLLPGVESCEVVATRGRVEFELSGVDWGHEPGTAGRETHRTLSYALDEAWLLGRSTVL